ncbi:hypothetical protein PJL18_03945 [Paenarthrobacter nicotinovorans]|nr:hypothetical protein [Paenarthrobacter nicotinovorans]
MGESELPRPVQHVGVAVGGPVVTLAVLAQAEPYPGLGQQRDGQLAGSSWSHRSQGDIKLCEGVNQPAGGGLIDAAQLVGVGHGHLALHPQGPRPFQHEVRAEHAEFAGFVKVDINGDLVLLGEAEHDVEVPRGVPVQGAGINATHHVGAGLERFLHEFHRPFLQ